MNRKCNEVLGYKNLISDAFIYPDKMNVVR
jgi:hypothetical protein